MKATQTAQSFEFPPLFVVVRDRRVLYASLEETLARAYFYGQSPGTSELYETTRLLPQKLPFSGLMRDALNE